MTLAEIIRAQLATGRPLRVTRALLEALDASETDSGDLAAYDRARAAERELADLDLVLPAACGSRVDAARELERERDEARRNASAWADERDAMRRERDEALARLHDAHNTIGRLDRARGGDGSAASIREAEERARANEWLAQKHDAERARDEARVEVERLRAERDEASESLRLSVAAWDAAGLRGRDAASVIREAEERGARWMHAAAVECSRYIGADHAMPKLNVQRICEAARKAGEHE